jgi:hypothetical protein
MNRQMPFQLSLFLALALGSLPFLSACNQTTAPALPVTASANEAEESGVLAAIKDSQRTQARHRMNSVLMIQASAFDPTGLSGYAIDQIEQEQECIEAEKERRIDEEVDKALAETASLQAESERQGQQKAILVGKSPRLKVTH